MGKHVTDTRARNGTGPQLLCWPDPRKAMHFLA